jgi:C4-dicarboxylate-specific signal transduction histidine kinase
MGSESDNRQSREQSLAFFGKIVAGQGHEITNVFNVINELTGLLQDLLAATERGRSLDAKRFKSISEKIKLQIQRGENIIRQVRYFAHNADVPVSVFDLRTVLEQVVFLAERHTRLHKSQLEADFPEETAALECSPFSLQQAVFVGIEAALLTETPPERIVVGYRIEETHARLFVKSEVAFAGEPETEKRMVFLRGLLPELGGDMMEAPRTGRPFAVGFRLTKATAPKTRQAGFAEEQRGS